MNLGRVENWTAGYEWKAVTLLALGFGLVGIDRSILAPLFPFIRKDLGLSYSQLGALSGIVSIGWGIAAISAGGLSDMIGRRRLLIPSVVVFSALAGLSGAAGGFAMLMLLRLLMGLTEGAYLPASVASVSEASKPSRRGRNQGLQLAMFPLIGVGLTPIIATQLLLIVPSWRYVFAIVSIPGFILAWALSLTIREPARQVSAAPRPEGHHHVRWAEAVRSRNVLLSIAGIICAMCCILIIVAMMPTYLTDYLKLSPQEMGFVMSAVGIGGFFGEFCVPAISDVFGNRFAAILTFVVSIPLLYIYMHTGANPPLLFALLLLIGFCGLGLLGLFTGPLPTASVSPASTATAIGLVSGIGEIVGGGGALVLGGFVAQRFGIQHILDVAMGGLAAGLVVSFFLRKSEPLGVSEAVG